MPDGDVTIGEVYRRVERLEERVLARLDELEARTCAIPVLHADVTRAKARLDVIEPTVTEHGRRIDVLLDRSARPGVTGGVSGGGVAVVVTVVVEWLKKLLYGG